MNYLGLKDNGGMLMDKSVYVVKAFPDGKDRWKEFQEKSIIAIGWPTVGDVSGKNKDDIKELLCSKYGLEGQSLGSAISQFYAFYAEISEGDYIIVPHEDVVIIGVVEKNYSYDSSVTNEGYPHQRKVSWKAKIPQNTLSSELSKKLHIPRTIINTSDYVGEVRSLIEKFQLS